MVAVDTTGQDVEGQPPAVVVERHRRSELTGSPGPGTILVDDDPDGWIAPPECAGGRPDREALSDDQSGEHRVVARPRVPPAVEAREARGRQRLVDRQERPDLRESAGRRPPRPPATSPRVAG